METITIMFKKKVLVYTAVGGPNLKYCELVQLLHKSLRLHHSKNSVDFAVICSEKHWDQLDIDEIHLNPFDNTSDYYNEFQPHPDDCTLASANSLIIQKFDIFHDYDTIMFLDADIIVCKPLSELFDLVQPGLFHAKQEGDLYDLRKKLHSVIVHSTSAEELEQLKSENIQTINAGTFMFQPSDEIENTLNDIHTAWLSNYMLTFDPDKEKTTKVGHGSSAEQVYLNDHLIFKQRHLLEYELFGRKPGKMHLGYAYGWRNAETGCERFCNEPWWKGEREYKLKCLPFLWHFIAGNWEEKLLAMRDCYKYIKPLYENE